MEADRLIIATALVMYTTLAKRRFVLLLCNFEVVNIGVMVPCCHEIFSYVPSSRISGGHCWRLV
jgi:cobalamin-dependent methionine synthase I